MKYCIAICRLALCMAFTMGAVTAHAQAWPDKPVRIVVPFSAGGSTDAIARRLAIRLQEISGTSVVVENLTGGGSAVGTAAVMRAKPDGTTLLLTGNGTISVMKHVNKGLNIDPEEGLSPITGINTLPHWIVVRADQPEKSFQQFVDNIRKHPGKVNISVNAYGGTAHLALAKWAKVNGLDFVVVPYRGSSAAMVDLLGGSTTAHVDVVGSSLAFVKSGKARALTLLQKDRIAGLNDVPAESQGLTVDSWHVLATARGTPDATITRIHQAVVQISAEPDFQKFIQDLGYEIWNPAPAATRQVIEEESRKYQEMVKTTGIKVE